MNAKNDFEFLNSELWLKYSQNRYLSPEEIKYRLKQEGILESDWPAIQKKIVATRKMGGISFFFSSIQPRFWYFPSDTIQKKIDEIEVLGKTLYQSINNNTSFKNDFFLDATIEEAITSAIYEGAHSTRAQAEQLLASGERPKSKDEWMLFNNYKAMKWVKENTQEKLTADIFLQLHKIVTDNTLEADDVNFSGKFRNSKVFVGPHEGINYLLIEAALNEMIKITTENRRYFHPLIKCILIHYFTAYIHPFFDGNGRTARALFYFKAMRNDLQYVELLSVSAYLKEHGRKYERAFERVVENDHDITYFIDFCLDSIFSALKEVSRKVNYLLRMNDLIDRYKLSTFQVGLLQRMALHKFRSVDIEEYAGQIKKSREFARQELKELVELNFLMESKVSKKLFYMVNAKKLKELYQDKSNEMQET